MRSPLAQVIPSKKESRAQVFSWLSKFLRPLTFLLTRDLQWTNLKSTDQSLKVVSMLRVKRELAGKMMEHCSC